MATFKSLQLKVDALKAKVEQSSITPTSLGAILDDFISLMSSYISDDEVPLLTQLRKLQEDIGTRPEVFPDVFTALNEIIQTLGIDEWSLPVSVSKSLLDLIDTLNSVISNFIGISGSPDKYTGAPLQSQIDTVRSNIASLQAGAANTYNYAVACYQRSTENRNLINDINKKLENIGSTDDVNTTTQFLLFDKYLTLAKYPGVKGGQNASLTVTPDSICYCEAINAFIAYKEKAGYFNTWPGCEKYGEVIYSNDGSVSGRRPADGQLCLYYHELKKVRKCFAFQKSSLYLKFLFRIPSPDRVRKNSIAVENAPKYLHLRPMTQNSPAGEWYRSRVMRLTLPNGLHEGDVSYGSIDLSTLFPQALPKKWSFISTHYICYSPSENKIYWATDKNLLPVTEDGFCYRPNYNGASLKHYILIDPNVSSLKFWKIDRDGSVVYYEEDDNKKYAKGIRNQILPMQSPPVSIEKFSSYIMSDPDNDNIGGSFSIQIQRRGRVKCSSQRFPLHKYTPDEIQQHRLKKQKRWINMIRASKRARFGRLINRTGVYRIRRRTRTKDWSEWRYFSVIYNRKERPTGGKSRFKVKPI